MVQITRNPPDGKAVDMEDEIVWEIGVVQFIAVTNINCSYINEVRFKKLF